MVQGTDGTSGTNGTSGTGFSSISPTTNNNVLTANGTANSANSEPNLTFNASLNLLTVTGNETVTGTLNSTGNFVAQGTWTLRTDPTTQLTTNGYYGELVTFGGTGPSTQYSVYQWKAGPAWSLTDANTASSSRNLLAIAIEAEFSRGMLLRGYVYNSSWNWTSIGGELYLSSTTAGAMTQTQPSGSGDIVRVVGYAISADLIYFNPSQDWIELA
jgi:hypothetical protein